MKSEYEPKTFIGVGPRRFELKDFSGPSIHSLKMKQITDQRQ